MIGKFSLVFVGVHYVFGRCWVGVLVGFIVCLVVFRVFSLVFSWCSSVLVVFSHVLVSFS